MSATGADIDAAALKKVFPKLVEGLEVVNVIDELYANDLLSSEEYEGILHACVQTSSKEDSRNVNRRMLMAIRRRPPGFVAKLVAILRKKYSSLANALEMALAEVSGQHQPDPAPSQQFTQDVQPSSSGVTAGPMSKWNVDALEALKGKLKLKVQMFQLVDMLHTAAGGFMNSVEAQRVRDKTGDVQQIEEVIDILQGKGDKEFATFCQMLRQSNYQVWAHELELEAEKFKTSDDLPSTDPAPLRQNPQAVMSIREQMPGPSREGVPPQQSANSTTHPPSPTLNNMCWPEFPALQEEFSRLVSKLSETVHKLEQPQFDSLLVYLRERLRPMVAGCLPTEASPNIPDDPTPSELVRHLQKCHYWDYLNTDLLEGIIRHISGVRSQLASLMTKYKKKIRSKVTRTLKECKIKNVKPEPPPNYTTIAVKINTGGNPLSFHLHQLLQLKDLLVQNFGVNGTLFAGFTTGSISLYFFIPEEAVYSLCPKLEANCTALEELHVTTLVVFGHFSVDVGYQQMALLHKKWPSQVSSLEEEVAQLKQQLKKSEVDREELSAELRECRKIKVEPREPLEFMKLRLKEERDEGEEPDRKKVKTEEADTVEVKLESHPQEEKEREEYLYEPPSPSIISECGPQTPSMFPPPSAYTSSEHTLELAAPSFLHPEYLEMGPSREEQAWVPPQVGVLPPHVSIGARPPFPQPSSFQQPVQMGPPGSQRTQVPPQVGVFPPHVSSGARPPVPQHSTLQPVAPQVPPQAGVSSPYVYSGAIPSFRQLSSIAQPVQRTPLGWQQTQVGAFLSNVSSGAIPPVHQTSSLLQPVPPQAGMLLPGAFMRASQPYRQPSSVAQPVQTTPVGSPQTQIYQTGPLLHGSSSVQSVKLTDLPIPTCSASAVMINDHIYVCGGLCGGVNLARQVQVYDVNHNVWSTLPHSPQYHSEGVAINSQLVLIGGRKAAFDDVTNLVSTWTGQEWQQDLPPMPTKRIEHGATTYHTFVVVAGGRAEDDETLLSSIDILNITTHQWWTPANFQLPWPMYGIQCTVSSAHLCVASACISHDVATGTSTTDRDLWQLPVTALEKVLIPGYDVAPHQWTKVAPTPYFNSAILQDTGHIVAVGGDDSLDEPTPDIFVYNLDSDVWSKVGQLSVPRACCAVVSLSRTSFIACGGCTDTSDLHNTLLSSVEVVHV